MAENTESERQRLALLELDQSLLPFEVEDIDRPVATTKIVSADSGVAAEIQRGIQGINGLPEDTKRTAIAMGIAMATSSNRLQNRTVEISATTDTTADAKLSKFVEKFNMNSDEPDTIITDVEGGEFKNFEFKSEYLRTITKRELLNIAYLQALQPPPIDVLEAGGQPLLTLRQLKRRQHQNILKALADTNPAELDVKKSDDLVKEFLDLCENANVVLACRVSPK